MRLKKSFGTALKLFDSKRIRIALALYAVVFGLGFLAVNYPEVITSPSPDENFASNFSTEFREKWEDLQTRLKRGTCDMSAAMEEGAKLLVNEVASRNATGLGGADIPMENALVNGPAGRNLVPLSSTEASSAAPSAPPPADRRYSELRMFSRMRNGTQGTESPSLQTDTTSVPIGSIGQNDPANMVPNLGVPNQGPVVMGAVPVPPVQWTASSVSVPPIAVSASVSAPYGLSSNDFAPPPSNQYIPVAPDLAPAPLMLP